jgi:elongation factor Ts
MSQVSMQQVKELRDRTQAGLNDCKAALVEAGGDMEKAVEVILKKGLAKSAKRAGSLAKEGEVAVLIAQDGKSGVIAEVNIQTDFAARNDDFKKFVRAVVEAATTAKEGADLGTVPYPGGTGTIEENRQALVGKLGENITIRRWGRLRLDGPGKVHSYVHMGGKIGVLMSAASSADSVTKNAAFDKFVDDAAMQIAAMAPLHLASSEVADDAKAKQAEIFEAQLKEEGKVPEKQWPKVVEGKVQKWIKEVTLLDQPSVMDGEKTVDQARVAAGKEAGGTIDLTRFIRFEVGEGIEQPKGPDFADEVAKMAGA